MAKKIKSNPENKSQIAVTGNQKALIELKEAVFHLRKVIVMAQDRDYCLDIIRESRIAVQFLEKADSQIKTYHLEKCVKRMFKNQGKDKHFEEVFGFIKGVDGNRLGTKNRKYWNVIKSTWINWYYIL